MDILQVNLFFLANEQRFAVRFFLKKKIAFKGIEANNNYKLRVRGESI